MKARVITAVLFAAVLCAGQAQGQFDEVETVEPEAPSEDTETRMIVTPASGPPAAVQPVQTEVYTGRVETAEPLRTYPAGTNPPPLRQYPAPPLEQNAYVPEPERPERQGARGFAGGALGAGFSFADRQDGEDLDYDTSLLFALRGGLLFGKKQRNILTFEVAPLSNRITWELDATASFFASYGRRRPIRHSQKWDWVWRVGPGIGGGGNDWDFLIGAQLDVLTFSYMMSEHAQVEFGIPTFRFYTETQSDPKYAFQLVFPLGISYLF